MEFWRHHAGSNSHALFTRLGFRRMRAKLIFQKPCCRGFERGLAKLSAHLRHIGGHSFFGLIGWSTGFGSVASSFFASRRALRSGPICACGIVTP